MSSAKDTRGTDPLDHLRLSCTEGNVVATKVAKAAYEYAMAEILRLTRLLDGGTPAGRLETADMGIVRTPTENRDESRRDTAIAVANCVGHEANHHHRQQ